MGTPIKWFTVIEEDELLKDIDLYEQIYDRIFDVKAAISWLLARNPFAGIEVHDEEEHRIYQTIPMGNTPSFWVMYRLDKENEKVYLVSIEPVERKDD